MRVDADMVALVFGVRAAPSSFRTPGGAGVDQTMIRLLLLSRTGMLFLPSPARLIHDIRGGVAPTQLQVVVRISQSGLRESAVKSSHYL